MQDRIRGLQVTHYLCGLDERHYKGGNGCIYLLLNFAFWNTSMAVFFAFDGPRFEGRAHTRHSGEFEGASA